jgi:malate synthase
MPSSAAPGSSAFQIVRSVEHADRVLTPAALAFLEDLIRRFRPRVDELLERRKARHSRFLAGELPRFLPETAEIRRNDWRVAPIPADLQDRRVEITGPTDRKMVINALNSGASVFMADFEDANSPTWANQIGGQVNLMDAIRRTITFQAPETGKSYALNPKTAVLLVRPRGWHLPERHCTLDGRPVPGALVDFGLYFFHNAKELLARGSGPYFYLPKMESHLEARLWNDVFLHAQAALGIPAGTIRGTVLIETLPAAFEMDEILYELRQHSAGLNCGRWDYIFSAIKTLQSRKDFTLPDRGQVTMTSPFLRSYSLLLIKTCHRRGIHAMGGMAAQIPIKDDAAANDAALAKVRADKQREVGDGHDGTWVAHPALVPIAKEIFDRGMPEANQISKRREDVNVTEAMLVEPASGTRTDAGLRLNIRVGIQYLEAWLRGLGCVPLYHLMEDAATAEISRAQVWQWLAHHATLEDGRAVTPEFVRACTDEEMGRIEREIGASRFKAGRFPEARAIFERVATGSPLAEFLTLPAYEVLEHA